MTTTKGKTVTAIYASTNRLTNLQDLTKGMPIAHPSDPSETVIVHAVEPTLDRNPRRALLLFTRGGRGLHQVGVGTLDRFDRRIELTPGVAATEPLVTDTIAGVISRVTRTTVTFQQVETRKATRNMMVDQGPWPVMDSEGILDRPIVGTEKRFTRRERDGKITYWNGRTRLIIGTSFSRRDYRD